MTCRTVVLSIDTETEPDFVEAYERLARQAAGLAPDGITARVWSYEEEEGE